MFDAAGHKVAEDRSTDKHIIHTIPLPPSPALAAAVEGGTQSSDGSSLRVTEDAAGVVEAAAVCRLRVTIRRPATQWGASLWRVEVYGQAVVTGFAFK